MSTLHVWHQQRKVTPYAGASARRHGYYGYRYIGPEEMRLRTRAANMARYRRNAPATVADRARPTNTLDKARWSDSDFRLVDAHGRARGQRYTCTRNLRRVDAPGWQDCNEYQVIDASGRTLWLSGSTRIRIINRQQEDLMSEASRLLTRAHRQFTKGTE